MSDGQSSSSQLSEANGFADMRAYAEATRKIMRLVAESRHDEQPVFEAIVEAASRLCDAPFAGLGLCDDERAFLHVTAWSGANDEYFKFLQENPVPLDPEDSVVARAIVTGEFLHFDDLSLSKQRREGNRHSVAAAEMEAIRTFIVVPLMMEGKAIGGLWVYRQEVLPFDDAQINLVKIFADQAVIAIENARQFRELQTRLEREAATREILSVISQSRDDEKPVFDVIVENAARLCRAPMARLLIANDERTHFKIAAGWGIELQAVSIGDFMELDPSLLPARVILENTVINLPDMREGENYKSGLPVAVRMVEEEGIRTLLMVPLSLGDRAIGAFVVNKREVAPFTEDEIALVKSFAAQAVIAIENVRQFRELQTRLEREAATREILEVISRSRDDERPVFDVILKNAALLCGSPNANLALVDDAGEHYVFKASWGELYRGLQVGAKLPLNADNVGAVAIREKRVVHEDLTDTSLYRERDAHFKWLYDDEGVRVLLAVPLLSGGEAIGNISMRRLEPKPFDAEQIALLETFAAQAVIAIENVRQFRELQTRLEREEATRQILHVISQSRDDENPVFDAILERSALLCKVPAALLVLVNDDRSQFFLAALWGEWTQPLDIGTSWPTDAQLPVAEAIRETCTVHLADIAKTKAYQEGEPTYTYLVDEEGIHSRICVPLIRNGIAIGAIVVSRHEVGAFDDSEVLLLETFAAQAVIAIENVRQFRELQTRLEREAATSGILEVISQSRDDEKPVFDVILQNAARLCATSYASLFLVDERRENFMLTAVRSEYQRTFKIGESFSLHASPTAVAISIREARVMHVEDLADDDLYRQGDPVRVRIVDEEGARTLLVVPLISGELAIGCITLWRSEVKPFSEDQIVLIQTFAAQAVIAIENVCQFRELQTRLEREEATRQILSVISQSRDDELPVFTTILESAARLCGSPNAVLHLVDSAREYSKWITSWGEPHRFFSPGEKWPLDSPMAISKAIRQQSVVHIPDMADDDLYREGNPTRRQVVDDEGIRTFLVVPLISEGQGVGCIVLHRREVRPFDDRHIALVETFATQAVIAIENVRQFRALQDRTREVQALNESLEVRVGEQVGEIERMGRLKRFLSPQVANAVISSGEENILSSHRALIGILFCDIRGFTAFCETAEPEETIEFLQTYHEEMGKLINAHGAGVDHRWGDGIMVIFNDPFPCEDPAGDALRLGLAMREKMEDICQRWKRLGHRLGFGVGISLGYATVGMVGSAGRFDYTASGTAVNLAARLCDHAEDGEILLSPRAYTAVEDDFQAESTGEMTFKGIRQPVEVFRVAGEKADA